MPPLLLLLGFILRERGGGKGVPRWTVLFCVARRCRGARLKREGERRRGSAYRLQGLEARAWVRARTRSYGESRVLKELSEMFVKIFLNFLDFVCIYMYTFRVGCFNGLIRCRIFILRGIEKVVQFFLYIYLYDMKAYWNSKNIYIFTDTYIYYCTLIMGQMKFF